MLVLFTLELILVQALKFILPPLQIAHSSQELPICLSGRFPHTPPMLCPQTHWYLVPGFLILRPRVYLGTNLKIP